MNKWLFAKQLILLCLLICPAGLLASTIYHWVDDNGVHHYTESPPPGTTEDVSLVAVEDTRSPDYDPERDLYGIAEQEERMQARRTAMAEKREKAREERERQERQRPVVVVQQMGYPYASSGWWNRPGIPPWRPPVKPELPIAPPMPEPSPPSYPFLPPSRR